ncbi:MAG: hypothetical protein JSS00_15215 [Proteobacteria bacterium]|nr:hypothetical protein [Pseudomonadota bacterium]
MRVILALAISILALAACKPPGQTGQAGPHVDPHALQTEIGRYGLMLRQTGELTATQTGAPDASAEDPKELARGLREAVWQYNIQRSQLCARNLFTETTCTPPYEPVWISEPPGARPTPEQLQQRSAEVGQEIQHFWAVICDDARHRTQDRDQRRSICAIE